MHTSSSVRASPVRNALLGVTLLVFLTPVIAYIACALQRLGSPVLLEWMEGGSLQMMRRALDGKSLYAQPSVEFVPYTYTPLYFYLSALISSFVGSDLLTLRLVSFTASLVSFLLLFSIVRRETGSSLGGLAAVGLFAGSYAVNGDWFDIARIDSLCMALLLGGMWLGLGEERPRRLLAGGLLVALAFFTKQVALIVAGPLMLAVIARHGKVGALFAASALATIIGGCLVGNALSGGWFLFYVLESPGNRWRSNLSVVHLARAAFLEFLPIFLTSLAVTIPTVANLIRRRDRKGMSLLIVVAGLFLAAAWGRVESINFLNSSIPAHLAMALLFGLSIGRLLDSTARLYTIVTVLVASIFQLAIFAMMLRPLVPTEEEVSNYSRYSSFIGSLPRPTYLPDQGFAAALGADNSFAHSIGIMDLMMGGSAAVVAEFRREMEAALDSKRFKTIVLDTPLFERWFKESLQRNYEPSPPASDTTTWTPVLGFRNQPAVWTPRDEAR